MKQEIRSSKDLVVRAGAGTGGTSDYMVPLGRTKTFEIEELKVAKKSKCLAAWYQVIDATEYFPRFRGVDVKRSEHGVDLILNGGEKDAQIVVRVFAFYETE
ncbi:MAG TPA: hypothetical protein VEW46_12375 [Pyrinomonadaceae bacterium]|nr:hypothetical protein [Pyrinomonadaceae bacterium]